MFAYVDLWGGYVKERERESCVAMGVGRIWNALEQKNNLIKMLKEVSVLPSPTAIQPQMVAKRVASIKTEKAYLKKKKDSR